MSGWTSFSGWGQFPAQMTRDSFLPRRGATYVALVTTAGLATIGYSAAHLYPAGLTPEGNGRFIVQWFLLAALTLLSGSATVKLPSVPATISISETFVFTAVLLFGPNAGATIVALDGFIISIWLAKRRKEFYRVLFNMAAPAVSIWLAAHLYQAFAGPEFLFAAREKAAALPPDPHGVAEAATVNLLALLVFTLAHFIINSSLIAGAVATETKRRPFDIWRRDFLWLSLNYFGGASVAALLVVYSKRIDGQYIAIIIPLLLILYFTFKIPMARVEDTNLHLKQVNTLYLSTIETLALAIDAKDQVTHGHIRRVQTYTVGLARALGIGDETVLKAIEASALLHDMGKLAIPEHILNKPGKLTQAEFDRMKMHAAIGADILSSINFPYPVVPIVRHHHENWDGSGYPSGIAGTAIPIGARILSVVDCFDALTSDRPYRPALSASEAIRILEQRRGVMYDPLVVDTFVRIHQDLLKEASDTPLATPAQRPLVLAPIETLPLGLKRDENDSLSLFALYQVLCDFSDRGWSEAADLVVYRLSRLIPVSSCAVFSYDASTDEIVCTWAQGDIASLRGHRKKLGEGVSGWVAANRQPATNSIAALDFATLPSEVTGSLRSALSVPLVANDSLVGVLSVYTTSADAYSEQHLQVVQGIAPHVASLMQHRGVFSSPADLYIPGYPGASQLDRFVRQQVGRGDEYPLSLLVVRLTIDGQDRRLLQRVQQLATSIAANLRGGDVLFACEPSTIVCLMSNADESAALAIKDRIGTALAKDGYSKELVRSAVLRAPRDGQNLGQLLASASRLFASTESFKPTKSGESRASA